ncbi:MAG: diaminopimelate epimerase [Lentisphaeria bacterium]|jgi:diaminopimelate epimerase
MQHRFWKYEALGNDYLVLDPASWGEGAPPPAAAIRRLCDRHFGLGSDGILWGPLPAAGALCGLRIFNPDGSEAEKSGNGLRIFARFLLDSGRARAAAPFQVNTLGGVVECRVLAGGGRVRVGMGRVSFRSGDIPVAGEDRETLHETTLVGSPMTPIIFCAASVGNPHCVVLNPPTVDEATARRLGPLLETHPLFPKRINVQFLQVLDRHAIRIEIWERGAGYTLASGSSASAAAAAACKLGLCASPVRVRMPGGDLEVEVAPDFQVVQTGPVRAVASGEAAADLLAALAGEG